MYYWRVKLYDGEELRVSPKEAESFKTMIEQKKSHITYKGTMIATKNISLIEETSETLPSENKRISSGDLADGPILSSDGELRWHWVKKRVNNREWNSYYGQHPSYRLLERNESGAVVAFKKPLHSISLEGVEALTDQELSRLKPDSAEVA